MSRVCAYEKTTTGHPCENVVEDGHNHCSAGHPSRPVLFVGSHKGAFGHATTPTMETEALVSPKLLGSFARPATSASSSSLPAAEVKTVTGMKFPKLADEVMGYYTGGWCWSLAWHLSRFGRWPIVTVGTDPPPAPWQHVCVRVGDRYLDAEGLHSQAALRRKWGGHLNELGTFRDRRTYMRHVFRPYQYGTVADWDYSANRTAKIARRIAERLTVVRN